ncbi:MAG: hypothetical protein LUP01_02080, partial [Methanothrix sp.]|nr:hypothetical protein [Methanothrix sp.]
QESILRVRRRQNDSLARRSKLLACKTAALPHVAESGPRLWPGRDAAAAKSLAKEDGGLPSPVWCDRCSSTFLYRLYFSIYMPQKFCLIYANHISIVIEMPCAWHSYLFAGNKCRININIATKNLYTVK